MIYTTTTAAALLECTPVTISRLCSSGELVAYKRLKKWFILQDDLIGYIKGKNQNT